MHLLLFAPAEKLCSFFARPCTEQSSSKNYIGLQHMALLTIVKNIALAHLQVKSCCRFQFSLLVSISQSTNTQNRVVLGCSWDCKNEVEHIADVKLNREMAKLLLVLVELAGQRISRSLKARALHPPLNPAPTSRHDLIIVLLLKSNLPHPTTYSWLDPSLLHLRRHDLFIVLLLRYNLSHSTTRSWLYPPLLWLMWS